MRILAKLNNSLTLIDDIQCIVSQDNNNILTLLDSSNEPFYLYYDSTKIWNITDYMSAGLRDGYLDLSVDGFSNLIVDGGIASDEQI